MIAVSSAGSSITRSSTRGLAVERLEVVAARRDLGERGDGVIEVTERDESLVGVEDRGARVTIGDDRRRRRGHHLVQGLRDLQGLGGLRLLRDRGLGPAAPRLAGLAEEALFHELDRSGCASEFISKRSKKASISDGSSRPA